MRNKIIIILIITIVALISTTTFMSIRINDLNRDLSISSNYINIFYFSTEFEDEIVKYLMYRK